MTPVVLAYLEGDDVAGVPVTRCAGCRCVLVTGPTCPACTPPSTPPRRPLSNLRRAWLCLNALGRAARPAEVATRLGCSPASLGPQLHKATRRQRPRFAHLPGGYYAALRWTPATDPSPTSSKIRGIR